MSKYILTGGSGTLGTELRKYLDCWSISSDDWDITRSQSPFFSRNQYRLLNNDFRAIIHAAAYTDVPGSENNKERAIETNINGTKHVKALANSIGVKLIYISTDYVYEGVAGNYKETDQARPVNFYAFTKLAGEAFLDPKRDLIIRTSFKPNDLWPKKYNKAFTDIWTSADFVDIVAEEIAFAIDSDLTGIMNIATERKTVYDLAKRRFLNVGKISVDEVSSVRMPRDISMNVDKFLDFKEGLK